MAADAHLLDELGEQAVLLPRPLLALQSLIVLLVLLQALEGAAVGLPRPQTKAKRVLLGMHPAEGRPGGCEPTALPPQQTLKGQRTA